MRSTEVGQSPTTSGPHDSRRARPPHRHIYDDGARTQSRVEFFFNSTRAKPDDGAAASGFHERLYML